MQVTAPTKAARVQARRAKQCRRVAVRAQQGGPSTKVAEAPASVTTTTPTTTVPPLVKPTDVPKIQKKGSFLPLLLDRTVVSIEDALAKLPANKDTVAPKLPGEKPRVVVFGSGWAAHSFIKTINCDLFDVLVVSPRNFFLFTPMLPSTAVGNIEFRSILEPIRVANPKVKYLEASCDALDVERKVAVCTSKVAFENGEAPRFEVPYDLAIVAVGEQPATFGVPGVKEHCFFMKEITDATRLRNRIAECFELASLPGRTDEERRKALHFVVVGGGPTGVEFAGTLSDFVRQDLRRKYPELMGYVRVTLLEGMGSILMAFDKTLAQQAAENLEAAGVQVRLNTKVTGVNQDQITLGDGEKIDYGVCVWSAGNAPRELVKSIASQIPAQAEVFRSKLTVDDFMRVAGATDCIALGDCSTMKERLPPTAQVAGQQGAYAARMLNRGFNVGKGGEAELPPNKVVQPEVVAQGSTTGTELVSSEPRVEFYTRPFEFLNLGQLAYVGNDKALVQAQAGNQLALKLYGGFAYLLWQSVYIAKQASLRNRVLILFDWLKASLFGRDISQF